MDASEMSQKDAATQEQTAEKDDLTACQKELETWKDRSLRITAEFDNYKKRIEREKSSWIKMTQANFIQDILAIVDDFDRALEQAKKDPSHQEFEVWLRGFELTQKSLHKLLQKYDVQEITDHEIFNPQYHEAIMQVDSPEHISGAVVAVLQKGYTFKGEVLRPAKVSVAK
jgi:molecular chaperone GrpE